MEAKAEKLCRLFGIDKIMKKVSPLKFPAEKNSVPPWHGL